MGAKITIDSATLMNKGFEVIEARWLFDLPVERIGVLVHPESIIHSLVEFVDGNWLAQLGIPDMRIPIAYTLGMPDRFPLPDLAPLDLVALGALHFEPPDPKRFPALRIAFEALAAGGTAPAALNAANEVAVAAFLAREIPFTAIAETAEEVLEELPVLPGLSLAEIRDVDERARARRPAPDRGATALNLPATIVDYFLPFVLLLGVLIVIHELGHFAVAKWLGVKVEKFSIGFGPSLFSRKIGETEYVLAALPLGGFVKMLGELPGEELRPEEAARAFNVRPVWQRIAIALAGPVMNMILPVFLIAAILMSGVPTTDLAGRLGRAAGLAGGTRGAAARAIASSPSAASRSSGGRTSTTKLVAPGPAQLALVGRARGRREGRAARSSARRPRTATGRTRVCPGTCRRRCVGVERPDAPAAQAGVQTGDRIDALNGAPVANVFALQRVLRRRPAALRARRSRARSTATRETVRVTVRELAGAPRSRRSGSRRSA